MSEDVIRPCPIHGLRYINGLMEGETPHCARCLEGCPACDGSDATEVELERLRMRIAQLEGERDQLRESVRRLNRRAQIAESEAARLPEAHRLLAEFVVAHRRWNTRECKCGTCAAARRTLEGS